MKLGNTIEIYNSLKIFADKRIANIIAKELSSKKLAPAGNIFIDLNNIVEEPKNIPTGILYGIGNSVFPMFTEEIPLDVKWRMDNWGASKNVLSSFSHGYKDEGFLEISFTTLGNLNPNMIKILARRYPGVDFELIWTSDEFGVGTGMVGYTSDFDGNLITNTELLNIDGSRVSFEISGEILGNSDTEDVYYTWDDKKGIITHYNYFEDEEE